MSAASKALYKPLSIATSVAGGLLAGKVFTEIWQRISPSDQEPPEAKDLTRSTREALIAAAVQGLDLRPGACGGGPWQAQRDIAAITARRPALAEHGIMA